MGHREFIVPADQIFIDHMGITPDRASGNDEVASLAVSIPAGEGVHFSYDVPGRSITLRVSRGPRPCFPLP